MTCIRELTVWRPLLPYWHRMLYSCTRLPIWQQWASKCFNENSSEESYWGYETVRLFDASRAVSCSWSSEETNNDRGADVWIAWWRFYDDDVCAVLSQARKKVEPRYSKDCVQTFDVDFAECLYVHDFMLVVHLITKTSEKASRISDRDREYILHHS